MKVPMGSLAKATWRDLIDEKIMENRIEGLSKIEEDCIDNFALVQAIRDIVVKAQKDGVGWPAHLKTVLGASYEIARE